MTVFYFIVFVRKQTKDSGHLHVATITHKDSLTLTLMYVQQEQF